MNNHNTRLRDKAHDCFAIADLLFHLMLMGQHPYRQKNCNSLTECIKNMAFPYPLGPNKGLNIPDGLWRFLWSHLPGKVKYSFWHTFSYNGNFSRKSQRLSVLEWKQLMEYYLKLLDSGTLAAQDPMSTELLPTRFKLQPGAVVTYCAKCGNEVEEKYCFEGVCMECRRRESLENGTPMVTPPIRRVARPYNGNRPFNGSRPAYRNRTNGASY